MDDDDDEDGGGLRAEVAAGMLVEELAITADDGACSIITEGCEVMPSEESETREEMIYSTMREEEKQIL